MKLKLIERLLLILVESMTILDIVLYLLAPLRSMLNWPVLNHLNIYAIQCIRGDVQVFIYLSWVVMRMYKKCRTDKDNSSKMEDMNINKL